MVRRLIMRCCLGVVILLLSFSSGCLSRQAEYPSPAKVTMLGTVTPEITNEEITMSSFPDFLVGKWSVYDRNAYDQNAQVVGSLLIDNGLYEFIPLTNNIPQSLYERLPFVRTPKGKVTCENVTDNLSDKIKTLAICVFEGDRERFQIRVRLDEIGSDKTLFFHGGYNELQQWQVKKVSAK